jgi:hypothetical protein
MKLPAGAALYALAWFAVIMLGAQGRTWNAAATAWMTVSVSALTGAFTVTGVIIYRAHTPRRKRTEKHAHK